MHMLDKINDFCLRAMDYVLILIGVCLLLIIVVLVILAFGAIYSFFKGVCGK